MKRNVILGLIGSLFVLTGCDNPAPTGAWGESFNPVDESLSAKLQENGVLALLNAQETHVDFLDKEVNLDIRAARELIAHRDGWDHTPGTADDNLFESMEEVDSVAYVGPVAMGRLKAFVMKYGWAPEEYDHMGAWKGVSFTWIQGEATLEFVNTCTLEELDIELGLDKRAAENIVLAQPISSINSLSNVSFVGTKTLAALRDVGTAMYMMERTEPAPVPVIAEEMETLPVSTEESVEDLEPKL